MVPLVKPLDIRKVEVSSYHAIELFQSIIELHLDGRLLPGYQDQRSIGSSCIAFIHAESAIASLMIFGSSVLTIDEVGRMYAYLNYQRCVRKTQDVLVLVLNIRCATKDVKHAVAIASAQKNKRSLEAESIVRAASTRVRFHLSTTLQVKISLLSKYEENNKDFSTVRVYHNLWDIIVDGDLQEEAAPAGEHSSPPAKKNQERVKSILLLAIPDEYLLKFHNVPDAKSLWAAIKSRFGGNDESKKM
ncbi:hypothetical protein Tco_0179012 [Tanacetum coccineum]